MSAVILGLALVFILRYSWLKALLVTVVTCFVTVNLLGIPLFVGCLLVLLLCSLRPLRVRTAHWAVWRRLAEYDRWRSRTRGRVPSPHRYRPYRRRWF